MTRPVRRRAGAIIVSALAVVAAGTLVAPAAAASPACGDTITTDTRLSGDLLGCPGDGLVIGADGITLDLAGHRIEGVGAGGRGIVASGRRDIVIEDGSVTGFGFGVLLSSTRGSDLRGLSVQRAASRGIQLEDDSDGNRVERNHALDNTRSGIAMFDSSGNTIRHNRVTGNGLTGIRGVAASGNTIEHNLIERNGFDGISFVDGSDGNRFGANAIADSQSGVLVIGSSHNLVHGNRAARTAIGVTLEGDGNAAVANALGDLRGYHECDDPCATGVSVEGGAGNVVARNLVAGSTGTGIRVNDFGVFGGPHTVDTVLRANVVRDAATDGIAVGASSDPGFDGGPVENSLIEANVVTGSGLDGIRVAKAPSTVTANRAVRNGRWGIEAVTGVIDGGRNQAAANGEPEQCVGIAC